MHWMFPIWKPKVTIFYMTENAVTFHIIIRFYGVILMDWIQIVSPTYKKLMVRPSKTTVCGLTIPVRRFSKSRFPKLPVFGWTFINVQKSIQHYNNVGQNST